MAETKRKPRRRTAPPSVVRTNGSAPEPLVLTTSDDGDADDERIEVFTIDDTTYTMPKRIGVNVALKYLRTTRKEGEYVAAYDMLEQMLGEDGYAALMNYDQLTNEQLEQVLTLVQYHVFGPLERAQGN